MTQQEYISVLESETKILEEQYYKPTHEGTGHFNTAISVLKFRIEELKRNNNESIA